MKLSGDQALTLTLVSIGTLLILVGVFAPSIIKIPFAVWAVE